MERRSMRWFAAAMAVVSLTACGGGGGDAPSDSGGSGSSANQSPSPSPGPNPGPGGTPPAPPPAGTPPAPPAPPPAGTPPAAPPPGSGTSPIPDPGPGPVTPFTVTVASAPQRGLTVEWTAVDGAVGYRIERDVNASDGVDNFLTVAFEPAPAISRTFTDLPLVDAVNYTYRIVAWGILETGLPGILATATAPVTGDLAASITVEVTDPVDDSFDNLPRAMATAFYNDEQHVLAVGMPGANQGKGLVRIYQRFILGGPWVTVQNLQMLSAKPGDHFGASVSLSPNGRYLAVGIPGDDRPTEGMGINPALNAGMLDVEDSGAVEVYRHNGTNWVRHSWFKAINAGRDDAFGSAVAISDEGHLIVGAPNEDSSAAAGMHLPTAADDSVLRDDTTNAPDRGAVYTYANGASEYTFGGFIKPPTTGGGKRLFFGATLAIDALARSVAVGAPQASYDGLCAGGIVVYKLTWALQTAPFPQTIVSLWTQRERFGPRGERVCVDDTVGPTSAVYRGLGGALSMSQDGTWLAAGDVDRSRVILYRNLSDNWREHSRPAPILPIDGDRFGIDVSLVSGTSGLKLLVGADHDGSRHNGLMRASDIVRDDFVPTPDSGAAYYFAGDPDAGHPLALKARLKSPVRIAQQVLGQATAMTRDGNELLLSGEHKNNVNPLGRAIFFGY